MKLITTSNRFKSTLSNLIGKHQQIAFAVAWASSNNEPFKKLIKNKAKIYKAVIGTHFFQTHPEVLENFIDSDKTRFILQTKGVFHPKIYIFWSKKSWDALIGSANFTSGAMDKNTEVMALISNDDTKLKTKIIELIEGYWAEAKIVNSETAKSYRTLWTKKQPVINRLSGIYGKEPSKKSATESSVMSMSWDNFYAAVKKDKHHGFRERCELLALVRNAFKENEKFSSMEIGIRKTIAGLPNDYHSRWGWFGSMSGAGYYHQAINDNNLHISVALDEIPLTGFVNKKNYQQYIHEFLKAFPNGRDGVGIASRLLALKRPDQFVCIDSKNKKNLCLNFGIKQTSMDYDRYWDEIVERIVDSAWWNEVRPKDKQAGEVWDGRAAMLDAIFYEP